MTHGLHYLQSLLNNLLCLSPVGCILWHPLQHTQSLSIDIAQYLGKDNLILLLDKISNSLGVKVYILITLLIGRLSASAGTNYQLLDQFIRLH